ncbi:hypothetical protein ACIF8T_16015 [Streptomyces sp. NPDC085946]|uniref:hypothetical protein n=1 Tax=Streptomyces sp. NPDC085946 TaxID=3365744 RepID=UPI0037D8EB10
MAGQSRRRAPQLARTDFESMTHEQLAAMLDSATSEGAAHLAAKLSKAASTITKIGDDLMTYAKGLEWQGEAGDAFRDWGGQTASATLRLGQYAEVASRWMATVAQAVAEAKAAMPDTSETTRARADLAEAKKSMAAAQDPAARNDPDARKLAQTAQSDAAAAQQRMEAARAEAVQQLRKLAQTYEYSAQQVNSVEPPTFSPPSEHMDATQWDSREYVSVDTGAPGTARGMGAQSAGRDSGGTGSYATTQPAMNSVSVNVPLGGGSESVDRSRPAAMEIDSVATLPDRSVSPATAQPAPGTSVPRPEMSPGQPFPVPTGFQGGGTGNAAPGRVPSGLRAPLAPNPVTGAGGTRIPSVRESGIVGGKPVAPTTGRPTGSIPRGTVIGGQGPQGHTPMGRGFTTGFPGGATAGTGRGDAGNGRRLASQPGGVVGGMPSQSGRVSPGRPVTQGGTGLPRPAGAAQSPHTAAQGRSGVVPGAMYRPGTRDAQQRDQRRTDRPDYLSEDEETWQRGNRRPLPPVVE